MNGSELVAGKYGGCPVGCNETTLPVFNDLENLAKVKANYWARVAVVAIKSLNSGHNKPNLIINELDNSGREFSLSLPGSKIYFRKRNNGEYLIWKIEADTEFDQAQMNQQKPGLYSINLKEGTHKFIKNGKIQKEHSRVVAVSDAFKDVSETVDKCTPFVKGANTGGSGTVGSRGYDLHFTPGNKRLGGVNLKQAWHAEIAPEFRESAISLAYTMMDAKETQNVTWISIGGGSGVLTQAMHILKTQNVNFSGSDHYMHFSRMRTLYAPAQSLALDLGINIDKNTGKTASPWSPGEAIGGSALGFSNLVASRNRLNKDPEYSALQFGVDVTRQVTGGSKRLKTIGKTALASSVAMGLITATTAGKFGINPSSSFMFATAVITTASLTPGMVQGLLPFYYNKIKDKLGV